MHLVHPPETIAVPVLLEVPSRAQPRMPRAYMPLHGFEGKVKPQPAQIFADMIRHPVFLLVQLSHTAILFMVKAEKVKKAPPTTAT